jgi:hypothetical protein
MDSLGTPRGVDGWSATVIRRQSLQLVAESFLHLARVRRSIQSASAAIESSAQALRQSGELLDRLEADRFSRPLRAGVHPPACRPCL